MSKLQFELRYWGDGGVVWSKGHHAPEEFCRRAAPAFEGDMNIIPSQVHHGYARFCGVFEGGKYLGHYLDYPVEQKRGSFPITYTEDFECSEDAYDSWGVFCGE